MQRRFDPAEPELMDRPQPVTAELASDLRNLRQLNCYFGSYALITRFLRRWIQPGVQLRVLDLATGSGDIPRLVINYARKIGATLTVDAIDQQVSTLEIARGLSADFPEIDFKQGDALFFEEDGQYDIVLCSLALHHFECPLQFVEAHSVRGKPRRIDPAALKQAQQTLHPQPPARA